MGIRLNTTVENWRSHLRLAATVMATDHTTVLPTEGRVSLHELCLHKDRSPKEGFILAFRENGLRFLLQSASRGR